MISIDAIARAICDARSLLLGREVGHGAFKTVFAVGSRDGETFALKIVHPGHFSGRTAREKKAVEQCIHNNVARIHDFARIDIDATQIEYFIEEFLGGGTLADRIKNATLPRLEAQLVGAALIDALSVLARNKVVHRDIKPENIMFRESDDAPVLVDFGLVRDLSDVSLTESWLPNGPGTPFYAAPEQLRNDKPLIDWRTDQFALGVTLSVASLGRHPYYLDGDSARQTVERVADRLAPPAPFVQMAQSAGLDCVLQMTAPWPVNRYRRPSDLQLAWSAQRKE